MNNDLLPDLSTVDIQAIRDSGPVHPLHSLPPLTTIASNWDSVEKNTVGSEDDSEEEEEDEELEKSHSLRGFVQDGKSVRTNQSSNHSSSDSSDSELSDATSDSSGSTTSTSEDSDSDSLSSSSDSSSQSKKHRAVSIPKNHPSFSVREAHYAKGRVTLRLSTLQQLDRKHHDVVPVAGNQAGSNKAIHFSSLKGNLVEETSKKTQTTAKNVPPASSLESSSKSKDSPNRVRSSSFKFSTDRVCIYC